MRALENHVHLVGYLATDPQIIVMASGEKLARFALSTKIYSKNESGKVETAKHWHRRFATIMEQFAEKGARVAVEGKLLSRFFKTKEGQSRYSTEIEVDDVVFLGHGNIAQSA